MPDKEKEIQALLQLMDDPDPEVFNMVAAKLSDYGSSLVPKLEQFWEVSENNIVQQRIENLIHRLHFQDLKNEMQQWADIRHPDVFRGCILVAKYQYPEINVPSILAKYDKIRRAIWLELNNYLTPIEQINVINGILYSYFKFNDNGDDTFTKFCINNVFDSHKGNAFTLGILYISLCEMLDIPILAINLPGQFVLAYFETYYHFLHPNDDPTVQLQYFIDPKNGNVFSQFDVNTYLRKLNLENKETYFRPLSPQEIIYQMFCALEHDFTQVQSFDKVMEIETLKAIIRQGDPFIG